MGSDRIGIKLNRAWAFGTNFLFQFEPVIRNRGMINIRSIFNFFGPAVQMIIQLRWKKVESDLIRCLFS